LRPFWAPSIVWRLDLAFLERPLDEEQTLAALQPLGERVGQPVEDNAQHVGDEDGSGAGHEL
jgi:hypothetical protein